MKMAIKVGEEYLLETPDGRFFEIGIWGKAGGYYEVDISPCLFAMREDLPLYVRKERDAGWVHENELKQFMEKAARVFLITKEGTLLIERKKND